MSSVLVSYEHPAAATRTPLRIGMFGLRGLRPDLEISGFETAFAEIAPRLVQRGHEVTIFCRAGAHSPARRVPNEDGIELVFAPSPGGKSFSALSATTFAVLQALATRRDFDVWFFVNVGMGHHAALARLSGAPVVMSVDGLDWERGKWGRVGRAYFASAARAAVKHCTRLVTDADAMRAIYRERFGRDSTMIAYGAELARSERPELLAPYQVAPRDYFLIVSRLVPENSLDVLLDGFRRSRTARRLVVVGGSTYRDAFHDRLRALAESDERIQLVGHVADQALLRELWCNCYAYLHGHSVGGTNPALLRAMGCASCVLALDTVFNREALGDTGRYFPRDAGALGQLIDTIDLDGAQASRLRARAASRAATHYTWDGVVDQYEQLFSEVAARSRVARR